MKLSSTADRGAIRAALTGCMYDQQGTILAGTATRDSGGRPKTTYAAVTGGTVACRLLEASDSIKMNARQENMTVKYRGYFPYDAPLNVGYQVSVGGFTYDILEVDLEQSDRVYRRALLGDTRS